MKNREKSSLFCTKEKNASGRMAGRYIMDHGINGKALHQPAELFRCHGAEFVRISWPCKVPAFHTLIKEQETIAFPKQTFYLESRSAAKEEECIGNKRLCLIFESNSIVMPFMVRVAVARIVRIAQFELYVTGDIFSEMCYDNKVLVVEGL